MVAAVLSAAGYRTGLFTSPHLDRVEERMAIDGQPCSPKISPTRRSGSARGRGMDQAAVPSEHGPTYFEIVTRWRSTIFAAAGRCGRAGGRTGRPARLDQRLLALRDDHHQHQPRPHQTVGRHVDGPSRRRRPASSSRACRSSAAWTGMSRGSDSTHRPAKRLPACRIGR